MQPIKVVPVSKIIEGAVTGDMEKVKLYANFIADDLAEQGELRASKIIRNALNPADGKNLCVLDDAQ